MSYICADWSYLLAGMFNEVLYEVGLGRRKSVYHRACRIWMKGHGIPFVNRPAARITLEGIEAGILYPDFVVWESLMLSVMAVPRALDTADSYPLLDWMKSGTCSFGLLVNLGLDQVEQQRIAYTPVCATLEQNWDYWSELEGTVRRTGVMIRSAIQSVHSAHGTGYGDRICGRLVSCALQQRGLQVRERPAAKAWFRGIPVDNGELDCFIVDERFLVVITARMEQNYYCVNRTLSFLRTLGLEWGVAVNFGHDKVSLMGLRR